jgi:hypothetical protein
MAKADQYTNYNKINKGKNCSFHFGPKYKRTVNHYGAPRHVVKIFFNFILSKNLSRLEIFFFDLIS